MEASKLGYQKWALAINIMATNLKGFSSMKLHRELGITQKSAWFLNHRIRECWKGQKLFFDGPVEMDETYMGGSSKNTHKQLKRDKWGFPIIDVSKLGKTKKTTVVGIKDRVTKQVHAETTEDAKKKTILKIAHAYKTHSKSLYRRMESL